jgi:hypothetical protein
MNRQELEELTRYIQRTRKDRTSSVEAARAQLVQEGIITPDGQLTEPYGGQRAA